MDLKDKKKVAKAFELAEKYKPLYLAVLRRTKDRKQAIAVVKYVAKSEGDL